MQCPFCHAALTPGAKFCHACGKSLAKICQDCGRSNEIAARFCVGCGYAFSSNQVDESGTEDAGTVSVPSQQTPINTPHPVPQVPQEPRTSQHAEPENAALSYASPPAKAADPSESKSVSKPDSTPESVGWKTAQSLSTPETHLLQPAPGGNVPPRFADAPRGGRKSIWIALFATVIVAGAAGGYYFYSQSSASLETDAIKVAQTAESPPAPGLSTVPESGTSALPEVKTSDGIPVGDNIEGLAADETEQIMARGERVYLKHCSSCHQVNGRGIPNAFPALDGSRVATGDIDTHIRVVMNGRGLMPAFGELLSDADLAALVTYQRNAWGNSDSDALLDPSYIKQFRRPTNKPVISVIPVQPQPSVKPPADAARVPEKPKGVHELLIGRWRMAGGIIEYRPDGSTQGYRSDGSPLNSGWWRLEGDRLTIGWERNGRRQEAGCTVLSVNAKELLCQNEREVQRATRLAWGNQPQRQVGRQSEPVAQDKKSQGSNVIEQIFNRELEKLKQCEGKWGDTPECPASSWNAE